MPSSLRDALVQQQLASRPECPPSPRVQRLYQRYIAGALDWEEVCALRDAPQHLP